MKLFGVNMSKFQARYKFDPYQAAFLFIGDAMEHASAVVFV